MYTYQIDNYKHNSKKELNEVELQNLVHEIESMDGFNPEAREQEERSRAVNLADEKLLESARRFMTKEDQGFSLDGETDYFKLSDEEVIDQYYERMRHYNVNTGSILKLAAGLNGDAYDEGDRLALRYMWDTWDNTVPFYKEKGQMWQGLGDIGEALVTDPSNWAGLATFGTATAVGQSGKFVARQGVKEYLKRTMPTAIKVGMAEGAILGGSHVAGQESVEESIGRDEFSWGDVAKGVGIGTVAGGGFGALFSAGTGLFHGAKVKWSKPKSDGKKLTPEEAQAQVAKEVNDEVKTKLGYDGDLNEVVISTSKNADGSTAVKVSEKVTLKLSQNGKKWEVTDPSKPNQKPKVYNSKKEALAQINDDKLSIKTVRATGLTAKQLRESEEALTKEAMGETIDAAERLALQQADETRKGVQRQRDFKAFVEAIDGRTAATYAAQGALKRTSTQRASDTKAALAKLDITADNFDLDNVIKKLVIDGGGLDKSTKELTTFGIHVEEVAFQRLKETATKDDAQFAENFAAYVAIASKNRAVGREAGSVLQQQVNRQRMTVADQLDFIQKITDAPDSASVQKVLDEVEGKPLSFRKKFMHGVNEYFVHNILGAISTMVVNVGSSLAKGTLRNMELGLGGLIKGDMKAARTGAIRFVSEASQTLTAAKMALKTMAESRTQTVQRNYTELANDSQDTIIGRDYKVSEGLSTFLARENDAGEIERGGIITGVVNLLGNMNRFLGKRVMFATDEFVKASSFNGSVRTSYINKYMDEGMSFADAWKKSTLDVEQTYKQHLRDQASGLKPTDPIVTRAINDANTNTFQQDMADDVFGYAGKFINKARGEHPWITVFAPFIRTPTNLLSYVGDRTPLLQNLSKTFQKKLDSKDPQEAAEAMGALMFGTAFWGGAAAMAISGNLTGKGPTEKGRRNTWKSAGNIPYAIITDDGTQIPISRLAPYANFFMLMGKIHDDIAYRNQEESASFYGTLALTTAMTMLEQPQLQGVLGLVETFTGDTGTVGGRLEKTLSKTLSSFAPFYRIYEELVGYGFMDQANIYIPEMHQISQALTQKPSALGLLNDGWNPSGDMKRNPITGEALEKDNPINSWYIPDGAPNHNRDISDEDKEVFYEMNRLGMAVPQPSYRSGHVGNVDMRKFYVKEGVTNRSVYDVYQELVGKVKLETPQGPMTLMENLHFTMNTDSYIYDGTETFKHVGVAIQKGTKDEVLKKVIDRYRIAAQLELKSMLGPDHPIYEREIKAKDAKIRFEANQIFEGVN